MKWILIMIVFLSVNVIADEKIKWDGSSLLKADVNCDGKLDFTTLGYKGDEVFVRTSIADSDVVSVLEFGLNQPSRQDALCGKDVKLSSYQNSKEGLIEVFDEIPKEYKASQVCHSLNISAGECDSIHMLWNHETYKLNWWRL